MIEPPFIDPGPLVDGDLRLVLATCFPGSPEGYSPGYRFEMVLDATGDQVGRIDLRIGDSMSLRMWAGHIGYNVYPEYRGNRYAARAVRLLLPLAKHHNVNPLWITCNPENAASRRTCELAGGTFVEIVDVPPSHEIYRMGEHRKCRYRFDL